MSLIEILVAVVIVILVLAEIVAKLRHESLKQLLADVKNEFKKSSTSAAASAVSAASSAAAATTAAKSTPAVSPVTVVVNPPAPVVATPVKVPPATTLPIAPPNPGQPLPPTVPIVGAAPFTIDPNTGFISVASLGGITQPTIIADGWLCSVLALPYLDPKSANYARVVQNCARDTAAEAASKALGQPIFANTAYDVVLQADGSYKTDSTKSMLANFIVPTEVNAIVATQAFCNAYPVYTEIAHVDAPTAGAGHALALLAARQAAAKAK